MILVCYYRCLVLHSHALVVLKSNTRGYMTYAATSAPDSRTTQLFINYANNSYLDASGFAPFARVTSGMSVVDAIYSGYGQTPSQVSSSHIILLF